MFEEQTRAKNSVIFGDFKAHSPLWETCIHPITVGKNITNFILSSSPAWFESEAQISPVLGFHTDHTATLIEIKAAKHTLIPPSMRFNLKTANWIC